MNNFEKIKHYYDIGIYRKQHLIVFVRSGAITESQYQEITGDEYTG